MNPIIDVHQHVLPDFYIQAVGIERITRQAPRGSRVALDWSARAAIETMDVHQVTAGVVSISAPGLWFDDRRATANLARRCNDFMANLISVHPTRFGSFASLPLPDVSACLAEIAHADDILKVDGFGIMSVYGNTYPGDPAFAPVFDELNRRNAVVFVHPNASDAGRDLLPGVPVSTVEFPLDTTRAVMSLLYSGTMSRCPNIRFIFSHAGGATPFLAHRMCRLQAQAEYAALLPDGAMTYLSRQFYDTALSANEPALAALERFVPASQILFGSDYPFAPGMMGKTLEGLDAHQFAAVDRQDIDSSNALRLFGRLKERIDRAA